MVRASQTTAQVHAFNYIFRKYEYKGYRLLLRIIQLDSKDQACTVYIRGNYELLQRIILFAFGCFMYFNMSSLLRMEE